jgi:GT2 family glycosyltransferase
VARWLSQPLLSGKEALYGAKVNITVIIPNWNGREMLRGLLKQLPDQTYPISNIIVVDNGSVDGSADVAEATGACVLRLPENRGFARAVNIGLKECRTELVAIINNDVELQPDFLERLVHGISSEHWFATGRILNSSDHSKIDGTFDAVSRAGCAWRCGEDRADGPIWRQARSIRIAPLTATVLRTDLFDRVGYLDERFGSYLEDVDFGIRCASKGYTGRYVPEAVAYHRGSATLGRWNAKTIRQLARNQVLLVAKHYSSRLLLRNGWAIALGQLLWGFVALRHGTVLAYLGGKLEGLKLFSRMRGPFEAAVEGVIQESERELLELQRSSGFDRYWRIYFALT